MKTAVLFSGGLDSTVLLYDAIERKGAAEVGAISFNYGQRHSRELEAAREITADVGCSHVIVNLRSFALSPPRCEMPFGGSSQTDGKIAVPHGHYADESMKATFVPNRNMIMLSLAASFALANGASVIEYAAHAGDHAIYPDCRPEFVGRLANVLEIANYNPIRINAPFIGISKQAIVELGAILKVPFASTWSCYEGREKHCGKCGTCVERREAFELVGVADPTEYAA